MRLYGYKYACNPPRFRSPSDAMAEGIVIHTGLAHYYARLGVEQHGEVLAAGHVYTNTDQMLDPHAAMKLQAGNLRANHNIAVDVSRLTDCLDAYCAHYAHDAFEVLAVEEVVSRTIVDETRVDVDGNPQRYLYSGRADVILRSDAMRESDKRTFVVDHKGFGGAGATRATVVGYSMSGQLHGWAWLGSAVFGAQYGGIILNLVGRDPPFKFKRPPLDPAPALVRRFAQTVIDGEHRILDALASGMPPDDWTPTANEQVCSGRYGVCDAIRHEPVCPWGAARR